MVADVDRKDCGVASNGDMVADAGTSPKASVTLSRPAIAEGVINEHDAMANEAVVTNGDKLANKAVALDSCAFSYSDPLLYFAEGANETSSADLARVDVAGMDQGHFFAEVDISNARFEDAGVRHVGR